MSRVVAITATYRRPAEIQRLLTALERSTTPLHGIVVVDNASDSATRTAVEVTAIPSLYEDAKENLGCGGGLKLGEEVATHAFPNSTHLWVLDDDTVPESETLATLLAAMEAENAGAACPQAADAEGNLNWFPGLLDQRRFDALRHSPTPDAFIERDSAEPAAFSWATGVALLVRRDVFEKAGPHRADFWVRGEDLDFSLRITEHAKGVYVPRSRLAHLPPGGGSVVDDFAERMKHAAMLQNCAWLAARTSHGRRLAKHWPGNAWRHLKRFGISALGDVIGAAFRGAVMGMPAGVSGGDAFRRKLADWSKQKG